MSVTSRPPLDTGFPSLCGQAKLPACGEVGAKLRAMMPWLAEGKLVDKTKN